MGLPADSQDRLGQTDVGEECISPPSEGFVSPETATMNMQDMSSGKDADNDSCEAHNGDNHTAEDIVEHGQDVRTSNHGLANVGEPEPTPAFRVDDSAQAASQPANDRVPDPAQQHIKSDGQTIHHHHCSIQTSPHNHSCGYTIRIGDHTHQEPVTRCVAVGGGCLNTTEKDSTHHTTTAARHVAPPTDSTTHTVHQTHGHTGHAVVSPPSPAQHGGAHSPHGSPKAATHDLHPGASQPTTPKDTTHTVHQTHGHAGHAVLSPPSPAGHAGAHSPHGSPKAATHDLRPGTSRPTTPGHATAAHATDVKSHPCIALPPRGKNNQGGASGGGSSGGGGRPKRS
jgi:hypothetical protein